MPPPILLFRPDWVGLCRRVSVGLAGLVLSFWHPLLLALFTGGLDGSWLLSPLVVPHFATVVPPLEALSAPLVTPAPLRDVVSPPVELFRCPSVGTPSALGSPLFP